MNTAAPLSNTAQTQVNGQDLFTAERISAQEAMKGMRISEPQTVRRRMSTDVDESYVASRVERHLASRAHSVRESSKQPHHHHAHHQQQQQQQHQYQPTIQSNTAAATGDRRRRSSRDEYNSATPARDWANTAPSSTSAEVSHSNNTSGHQSTPATAATAAQHQQYRQPHNYSPAAPEDDMQQQQTQPQQPHSAPASPAPSTASVQQPSSGRQSRMSNAGSSRESYRRKYGDIPGYSYIGTIGQGNFGKVLLAENDMTGEQVAVKILEKAQFKSEQQRLHATREARLMKTLRHPHIVDVKDVLEDEHRILIIMENLTGGELFDYISNKGSLEEKEARRIFHQIVQAIHYCHENNVVHRDLKPENILLDGDRNVRVADFGFGNNWHKDRHLTTYCGSPFYAAPEMVSGTPYIGPETDVWSLGVILYVLVCGRLPFDAGDLPQLFAQIKRGNYQKPREGSIDVCSLIHRMLTVDPKRRATLTDVLRSRWMRTEGSAMESVVTTLPALSTAAPAFRPAPNRPQQPSAAVAPQQQRQAHSTGLNTFHPNNDISTTMVAAGTCAAAPQVPPTVVTTPSYHHQHQHHQVPVQNHRHSYHSPGAHDVQPLTIPPFQQPVMMLQSPLSPDPTLQDDQMSDVSASMTSSPTETMATISPSTPVGHGARDDALLLAAGTYQKRSSSYDEKHHPYKHHTRANSTHHHHHRQQGAETVMINMCPSTDALMDGFDSSSKKKRKALTKLRQFFRFETNKC